jgi:hypothetical protein
VKKYSADYFEKKFKILFSKLLAKKGFLNAVKEMRIELEIPDNGFENETILAHFLITKMSDREWRTLGFATFIEIYEQKHETIVDEKNKDEVIETFINDVDNKKGGRGIFQALFKLDGLIQNHNELFTTYLKEKPIFIKNKFLSQLSPKVFKLMNTYWGFDLLDEHIVSHFIEKYLFLGDYGIAQYIKNKVACPNCRYIGVQHFSPERYNMQGQDKGVYTKGYIFNKATVKQLSSHFNSVFLIIKPYATKEQVHHYIEDNWNDLKEHILAKNTFYKQFDVHPSKIKESDFERNNLIYELYKLPKKELIKIYKGESNLSGVGIYKENVISAILDDEHGIKMTSDAIKKAATRFAKSTKAERLPKDIGDI